MFTRTLFVILLALGLTNCSSTYTIKPENSKNGMISKAPNWYVTNKKALKDEKFVYGVGSAVSPDIELAINKSKLLAKSDLADRVRGEMNERKTLIVKEVGDNNGGIAKSQFEINLINIIGKVITPNYKRSQTEVYKTANNQYRAYVQVKLGKEYVDQIARQIKTDNIKISSLDEDSLDKKVEKVLDSISKAQN
jgi:hypothetical protein